jgi:hypothetical protein
MPERAQFISDVRSPSFKKSKNTKSPEGVKSTNDGRSPSDKVTKKT